jgi:hypothetical protein
MCDEEQGFSSHVVQFVALAAVQAVVIKLESSEPEQLRQDMIAAVNRTLNQG